eukprot:scaffold834_cov172-Amphora_coffeaeformis.AAC.12
MMGFPLAPSSSNTSGRSSSGKFMFKPILACGCKETICLGKDRCTKAAAIFNAALLNLCQHRKSKVNRSVLRIAFLDCSPRTPHPCDCIRFLQRERMMSPVQTFQRITSAGIEEIMFSRPYGIQVSNLNNIRGLMFHFHRLTESRISRRYFPTTVWITLR